MNSDLNYTKIIINSNDLEKTLTYLKNCGIKNYHIIFNDD
jgi:hypothetical protein